MKRPLLSGVVLSAALLWLAWPWLRPRLWPAQGATWLVVLDGYHRLDAALVRQQLTAEPILLITCPSTGQPTTAQRLRQREVRQPLSPSPQLVVLKQGFDTATQITALAQWLQQQHPLPKRVWIATDPDHTARAVLNAQIALGPRGIQVGPPPPPASPAERRKLLRDALRLQLWRATGSTGAWLAPQVVARKRADCGV